MSTENNNTPESGSVQMNNNPIKLLFELGSTAVDTMKEYHRRGMILSDEEKMNARMTLCSDCKSFDTQAARCNLCGCFMKIKVRLEAAKCPIGKW